MKSSIAAVVVLYNPESNMLDNILSYINNAEILFVVDNSDKKNETIISVLQENPKIIYQDNKGNQGIAHALNVGCNKAIDHGYDWILTMDQDSSATPYMIEQMVDCLKHFRSMDNISIVTPFHASSYHVESTSTKPYTEVLAPMTSGNLLNLVVYKQIGPFREELFIDYVDNDYCLRSKTRGYEIIQVNNAILEHKLGDLKQHRILWKTFYSTNHSPIRRYYAFRNRIYMINTYKNDFPAYCKYERNRFFIDFIIVLLYEQKKLQKFKMMFLGIRDALRNKYGKFNA